MNNKKKAFTITEIVVAMLVLGAIAMILTPALYNSTEERVTDAALNKTYSSFQQTARSVGLLISSGKLVASSSPAYTFFQALAATSKTINALDLSGDTSVVGARSAKVINEDDSADDVASKTSFNNKLTKDMARLDEYLEGYEPDSVVTGIVSQYNNTIILKNGVFVMFDSFNHIIIDVNGRKAPNKVGRDIFYFTVSVDSNSYSIKPVMTGSCSEITSSDNTQTKKLNKRIGCTRERLKVKL